MFFIIPISSFFILDAAQPTDELWSKEEIYQLCAEYCVSLKLQSDSQTFEQFKQICKRFLLLCKNDLSILNFPEQKDPVTVQPTTYLIGTSGLPLEVVTGTISADEFVVRMSQAIEKHTVSSQASSSAANESGAAMSEEAKEAEAAQKEAEKSMNLEDKVAL